MRKLTFFVCSCLMLMSSYAATIAHTNNSGVSGSINNNTGFVIECSQVIGGYCANNPMPANGYIQMLPDPGSQMITGHIMVFDMNKPGGYIDNILFTYKNFNHQWKFIAHSLYHKIKIVYLKANAILLTR